MRHALLSTLITVLLTSPTLANPRAVQFAAQAAVYVEADGSRGSGVVVAVSPSRTLVLTAEHVVSDSARVTCAFALDGPDLPARVVAEDPAVDLALLEVSGPHGAAIELALSVPAQGEEVVTVGTPRGLCFFARWGHVGVSGTRRITGGPQEYLALDMVAVPGMSGGAICGMDGRLVGLLSAGNPEAGVVLAVPGRVVARFLDRVVNY